MRVFYDHQVFSLQNSGGGSRYFYELMRYLTAVPDLQVEALFGISGTSYPFRRLPVDKARVTAWRESLAPGRCRYLINEALSRAIVPFRGRMDVYHATHHRILPAVRSRSIVVTHHDCTHERYPAMVRHAKQVIRAKAQLYESADAIICVSEASRRDLLDFYRVPIANTRVIHHGIASLPRSAEATQTLLRKLRREYILFVGKRGLYKNAGALVDAFFDSGLHKSLDLVFVGGGTLTAEEIALFSKFGISQSVISFPSASDELLAEAYAHARLFVYPSLWEGFGFPPLEAMSVGCPVLASRVASIPEVCLDAPFYFDPSDPVSLTKGLARALGDEQARARAIKRGKEVATQYCWEKCGAETLALYRECV